MRERLSRLVCPKCGATHNELVVATQGVCLTRPKRFGDVIAGDVSDGHCPTYSEDVGPEARALLGLDDPDRQRAVGGCGRCDHAWLLPTWVWDALWD